MIDKIRFFRSVGPLASKSGAGSFYMAFGETPNPVPGGFSTLRVRCVSQTEIPTGRDVPVVCSAIDFEKGEANVRLR